MNAVVRLGIYAVGLLAVFGVAAGVGAAAGPIDVGGSDHDNDHGAASTSLPAIGARIVSDVSSAPAGAPFQYTFTVEGASGPVVDFELLHERRLHLILVSDDLVDFWHLHPEMSADGTWHVEMPALEPRVYVVYADFQPTGGAKTTLQQRIAVTGGEPGAGAPRELPVPAARDEVDGFEVTLSGTAAVGESTLQFDVTRNGEVVTTEPYLGAAGHLVAIRASDLDYLHVHPLDEGSPSVRFAADLATAGTYRLFLDFSVDGTVHTASFTLEVAAGTMPPMEPGEHEGHGS
jgi:hypothetical protein